MTTRSQKQSRALAGVFARLRTAGVPLNLTAHEAYYLSGGIVGREDDHRGVVNLSTLVERAPDAEAFLPDWENVR